jgi:hypothetical protein
MDPFSMMGMAGGLSSMMSGLGGLFGSKKQKQKDNPANAANQYLNQIPGVMNPYFQPYINAGQQVDPQLQQLYSQMIGNPQQFYNQMGQGYKESPGYQTRLQQALGGAGNAAAAGGMLGSPMHQQQAAQISGDMASQDYEQYLNHMLGLFGGGLSGQQGISNRGYEAGTRYGENLGNILGNQADVAFKGQAGQNLQNNQNWSNLFGGLGQAAPWLMSGMGGGFQPNLLGSRSYG